MSYAHDVLTNLAARGTGVICNSMYIFDVNKQRHRSMLGQRTAFIAFHERMFSMQDTELQQLQKAFKKYWSVNNFSDDVYVYIDVQLLKNAIDYQLAIRTLDAFDVVQVSEEIAFDFFEYARLAESYKEVDSARLLELIAEIKTH